MNEASHPSAFFLLGVTDRDAAGHTRRLGDYAGRWLLLVFHRHLA